jgi:hypothetical protein
MLGTISSTDIELDAADINGDGIINVTDVTLLIDLMLE